MSTAEPTMSAPRSSATASRTTASASGARTSASGSRVTDHYGTPPAGALTTIWTPPCGIVTGIYTTASETCMPPGWDTYWTSYAGYYSPAICPSGYTPGCTRTSRQGPATVAGETAVNCVPSGFSCPGPTGAYLSHAVKGTTKAAMIQIRWKATDIPNLQTHPLANADLTKLRATSGPGQPQSSASGGLSTGAIVGIAVGAGTGLLVLVLSIFFLCSRGRRRNNKTLYAPPLQQVPLMEQQPYGDGGYQQGTLGIMGAPPPPYTGAGPGLAIPHFSGYKAVPSADYQPYPAHSASAAAPSQEQSGSHRVNFVPAPRSLSAQASETASTPAPAPSPARSEEETVTAELQELQKRQAEIEQRRAQLLGQQGSHGPRTELQ